VGWFYHPGLSNRTGDCVARYKDRPIDLGTLVPRFDSEPFGTHVRNANALIERMAEEGNGLFGHDSPQSRRWKEGWEEVKQHISRLGQADREEVPTVLREFIHTWEHLTERMDQMMFGLSDSPDTESDTGMNASQVWAWTELTYRAATYAIVSAYIPDKQETSMVRIAINLATRKTTTTWERIKTARVPRKYRHATKRL